MAVARMYSISLEPATQKDGFISITFDLRAKAPRKTIEATSLDAVLSDAKQMATDYGAGCAVFIRCHGRKPPGFDTRTRNLYFNLDDKADAGATPLR